MAETTTTNYAFGKYTKGDIDWHIGPGGDKGFNGNMDLIDAQIFRKGWVRETVAVSIALTADDTWVGEGYPLTLNAPGDSVIEGIVVKQPTPGGTAGGDKTFTFSIGTAENLDHDLDDANEKDVLSPSGIFTEEVGYATDFDEEFYNETTALYLNVLGRSASATGTPGTITATFVVWVRVVTLPTT